MGFSARKARKALSADSLFRLVRDWAAQIARERSDRFLSHFCSGGVGGKCPAPLGLQ